MKRKEKGKPVAARACQLRSSQGYSLGALRGFVPLGTGEEEIYRKMREAIPVLDAAVGKLVRLSSGFSVKCRNGEAQKRLEHFLRNMPSGYGQVGIDSFLSCYLDSFLSCYLDSLLTYGRAVGEILVADGRVKGICWGDVTALQVCQGDSPMDVVLWGPNHYGRMEPLPYQQLLLFTTLNPEPKHPYGVSLFRGMPFLADILMKIYASIGSNWERAGNVRYSVICKNEENADPVTAQERGNQMAQEWARAMEDGKNGTVRDFVAVGDVEIKVIGGEAPILDSQVPVRQMLEQLVAKTGLPPFILGLNWSTTERMSTQQADLLTSELWALRRTVEPALRKICRMYLALEGLDDRVEILWDDISLQDITEQAQAELYHAQAKGKLNAEQVYVFSVRLCDDQVDRDGERFDTAALTALAKLFIGKTGIVDHKWTSENQVARIFETQVVRENGVSYIKAWAYIRRGGAADEVIADIEAGIKKEVSVGCAMGRAVCSICGSDYGACGHQKGEYYDGQLCCAILKEPMDAYEFSFVAVPAQRDAGVLKALSGRNRCLKELAEEFGAQAEYLTLYKDALLGRQYRKELEDAVVRLCLMLELGAEEPVLRGLVKNAGHEDLMGLKMALQERVAEMYPARGQLPNHAAEGETLESGFLI